MTNYMCIDSWDATTGLCCKDQTSLACKKANTSLCSSSLTFSSASNYTKYAYCPFSNKKCFNQPILSASTTVQEVAASTIDFGDSDVCSWKMLAPESEIYFSRQFNITIDKVNNVDCKILFGQTLNKLTNEIDCSADSPRTYNNISASNQVVIVAIGKGSDSYI